MRYKTIFVEWIDSHSVQGWTDQNRVGNLYCVSIGFLVHEDKEVITLASCIDPHTSHRSPITIPKIAIKRRKEIKVKL